MKMENENITGDQVLELIRDTRKVFHSKARFPNAILIHPGYYSVLKKVINLDDSTEDKKIFDLIIYVSEDVPSFELIRIYDSHECSIWSQHCLLFMNSNEINISI